MDYIILALFETDKLLLKRFWDSWVDLGVSEWCFFLELSIYVNSITMF